MKDMEKSRIQKILLESIQSIWRDKSLGFFRDVGDTSGLSQYRGGSVNRLSQKSRRKRAKWGK